MGISANGVKVNNTKSLRGYPVMRKVLRRAKRGNDGKNMADSRLLLFRAFESLIRKTRLSANSVNGSVDLSQIYIYIFIRNSN